LEKDRAKLAARLKALQAEQAEVGDRTLASLSERERRLHECAFCINTGDRDYREVVEITYKDGERERRMQVPKGNVFHQFRADVAAGKLPTVSWLVAPEAFSDHPSSAWFGAWYLAETIKILTRNPDVWKKTIFILNYDENDGYFDHVPPFVAPHPRKPETGNTTAGIDATLEHWELEDDLKRTSPGSARGGPIGLGYRVPMIIASPWSRGGAVCSQVFDHTSVIQFLEVLLSHKCGKKVVETNINSWRRAVCGDLTAALQAPAKTDDGALSYPNRDEFLATIHRAQFKDAPTGFRVLTADQIEQMRRDPGKVSGFPKQEPGVRASCPLPYELTVNGALDDERKRFRITFEAQNRVFRERAAGAPFNVYAFTGAGNFRVRNYAVEPASELSDAWALADFDGGRYHLRVDGPNGFFREFTGDKGDPAIEIHVEPQRSKNDKRGLSGNVEILVKNRDRSRAITVEVRDNSYGQPAVRRSIEAGKSATIAIDGQKSAGWYDVTCRWSTSDPAMAKLS
jgi:phospholipase C